MRKRPAGNRSIDLGLLAKNARGYVLPSLLAPVFVIIEVVLEVLIPREMGRLVDNGIAAGDMDAVWTHGGIMLAYAFLALVAGALSARFASVASMGFAKNLRSAMFDKIQSFSFANVDKFSTGSLVTRMTTDVTFIRNAYAMCIRVAFRAPIMFAMSIAMTLSINAEIGMIFVIVAPVLAAAFVGVGAVAFPLFRKMFRLFDKMNSAVQENLIGIRVVKAFVKEDHETEKFRKTAENVRTAQVKAERLLVYGQPLMQFIMFACMVAVVYIGGSEIISATSPMTIGDLTSFISYVNQILMSLLMVAMIFVNLVISSASAARVSEVLKETPSINDSMAEKGLEVENGSVEFENVSFKYPSSSEETIKDLSLKIEAGSVVGVIGGTGSAKSTLVQLIPRLYDVDSGAVKVGGVNVMEYPVANLRASVAMVLQKNVLFSGSIRENLKWGDENATDEEIMSAARAADAEEFIDRFPEGLDTYLDQGGVNLSGGQKQRLCIARALLKKPKIMILDDSTSAVDTATDQRIRAALKERFAGMTVIIIAQRVSSVMDADEIIVMDGGAVVARGTHRELYYGSEIYREVCISQHKGADDETR